MDFFDIKKASGSNKLDEDGDILSWSRLIVGLHLDPSAWIAPQDVSTRFIVNEDHDGEGDAWKPPIPPIKRRLYKLISKPYHARSDAWAEEKTYLSGYMRNASDIPGPYERNAARRVSKTRPKLSTWLFIPWCTSEFRRVLQMIKSAHCTTTIAVKKAVWQVYSNVLRCM